MARSLRTIGVEVVGVSHRRLHPHNYSRLIRKTIVIKADRRSVAWALAVASVAAELAVDLVMPVDFIDMYTFSKWSNFFTDKDIGLAAPLHESVSMASRKDLLPELLSGVANTPRQLVVREPMDVGHIDTLKPPIVVKGLGDASRPEYFPSISDAAKRATERAPCLVQEYISGVTRGYYVVAFRGKPLLEFTHERIIEYDPSGGASLAAKGPVRDPNLYRLGRRITSLLNWTGPLMVETKWQVEHGKYIVVELNPKFWGSLHLPVSLGYHFPAVLAVAYLEGPEYAVNLAKNLKVSSGEYYWVIDGLRYLAKLPEVWLFMVMRSLKRKAFSDLDISDPARLVSQTLIGLSRLRSEKEKWVESLRKDARKLRSWMLNLSVRLTSSTRKPLLIFDLDSTLISLKVNWKEVRERLIRLGLAYQWEEIRTMLFRLWSRDRKAYNEASRIIEEYELKAANFAKSLVDVNSIEELTDQAVMSIATLQSERSAREALGKVGLEGLFDLVVGRDSGVGPLKEEMFKICLKKIGYSPSDPVIVFEDNLANTIAALRLGLLPILVARNKYKLIQAYRLGIPSIPSSKIHVLLARVLKAICKSSLR